MVPLLPEREGGEQVNFVHARPAVVGFLDEGFPEACEVDTGNVAPVLCD